MFALEFARAHARDDAGLRAQLPVPSTLQELVEERVRRLPQSTKPLLELMSAVERPTPALLAGALDRDVVGGARTRGRRCRRHRRRWRRRGPLHPPAAGLSCLLRHAIRPPTCRAPRAGSPRRRVFERRARHLALATSTPDATIADVVERAAEAAAARGAPDAAALLAAEAERLTPPVDRDGTGAPSLCWRGLSDRGGRLRRGAVAAETRCSTRTARPPCDQRRS